MSYSVFVQSCIKIGTHLGEDREHANMCYDHEWDVFNLLFKHALSSQIMLSVKKAFGTLSGYNFCI